MDNRNWPGGQRRITYYLIGDEWIQVAMRNQKIAKDFVSGGMTINESTFKS